MVATGLALYCSTSLCVALGVVFSTAYVRPQNPAEADAFRDPLSVCCRSDGVHYWNIVERGYDYNADKRSTVAFFPAYPIVTRWVRTLTGVRTEVALLLVSNMSLAVAFVLLAVYDWGRAGPAQPVTAWWTLLAFGLWPGTFFFRMAYAESLFLAIAILTLIGIHRRWPRPIVAVIAGAATATRPVGLAVTVAFLWSIVRSSRERPAARFTQAVLLAPVACWGILCYMAYQEAAFGNPLAFAQTQQHWTSRIPVGQPALLDKAWDLVTLEPIWGVFDPESPRYWRVSNANDGALFNLFFWNPVLFTAAAVLIAWGAWRQWLTGPEIVLGAALLAIPYVTRAYEMSMASHARFAATVVVIYPVLGRLLASWPPVVSAVAVTCAAALMLCWTALYTAGYDFF